MPGALPQLPPELSHLTPDQQKLIFGRYVGGGWVTPTLEGYNQTMGILDDRSKVADSTLHGLASPISTSPTYQQPSHTPSVAPSPGPTPQVPGLSAPPAEYSRPDIQQAAPQVGQAPAPYQRPDYQSTAAPQFQGTLPAPELMSLEEMMSVVNNRSNLAYDAPIAAKERGLEEEMLRGEQTKGEVRDVYAKAMEDLRKAGQGYQRGMADQMRAKNIYDSGLSVENSNRIYLTMLKSNLEISSAEAKELSNLAEYLDLRQRHSGEEIQQMMGEKAMFAQSLLDEMHLRNQDRGDMLAQREFENWLAQQHFQLQNEQTQRQEYWTQVGFDASQVQQEYDRWFNDAMFEWQQHESQLNEYWRQVGFDSQMAQQEYQGYWDQVNHSWNQHLSQMDQYRWGSEFDARQHDAAWSRIDSMNRWEAEMELARLQHNNQITQQEFNNMMALSDQEMKAALYRAQYGG